MKQNKRRALGFAKPVVLAMLLATGLNAGAATVKQVGTVDLASRSEFVFQGTVVESWVSPGSRQGSIVTHMRFSVSDVLKGDATKTSVVLSFLGGTLNGRTLRVEGLQLPAVGEEGIFFVERLSRMQVHPLYGWDQGRFLVIADTDGRKSVYTHQRRPIKSVSAVTAASAISTGHAVGIEVSTAEGSGLSVQAFKQQIRGIVESQQ